MKRHRSPIIRCCLWIALLSLASLFPAWAETGVPTSILLVASERMKDPRFKQTVVLVTRHGRSQRPLGVILNRPLAATLDRAIPDNPQAAQHRLHDGGPLARSQLVFLVQSAGMPAGTLAVAKDMYMGSNADSLLALLSAPTPANQMRVFSGFSAWAPSQLENEVGRGDWHILPVDAAELFSHPADALWPLLWRRATQIMTRAPASGLLIAAASPPIRER